MNFGNGRNRVSGGASRGFTLIEVLIAVTIFAIVMSGVYGIFSAGVQIWRRTQGRSVVERKAVLALERLSRDLRHAVRTQDDRTKGSGNAMMMRIPSLIKVQNGNASMVQYGCVEYHWASASKTLCRREINASDLSSGRIPPCRVLATNLRKVGFRYLVYKGIGESHSWYDSWSLKDELPLAVQIDFELEPKMQGEKVGTEHAFHKTVAIPAGGKHQPDPVEDEEDGGQGVANSEEPSQEVQEEV